MLQHFSEFSTYIRRMYLAHFVHKSIENSYEENSHQERNYAESIVDIGLLVVLLVMLFSVLYHFLGIYSGRNVLAGCGLLVLVSLYYFKFTRNRNRIVISIASCVFLMITFLSYYTGGLFSPNIAYYLAISFGVGLMAKFVLGRAFVFGGFTVMGIFLGLHISGHEFPPLVLEKNVMSIYHFFILLGAFICITVFLEIRRYQYEVHIKELSALHEEVIKEKSQEIKTIMRHIPQGIFTFSGSGRRVHHEYSKYLEAIFDTSNIADVDALSLLFSNSNISADEQDRTKASLNAILGEIDFNYEINVGNLVKELTIKAGGEERILSIDWHPISNDDAIVEKMLVSVKDVTDIRKLELEAKAGREELKMIGEILAIPFDRFANFISHCEGHLNRMFESVKGRVLDDKILDRIFISMHTMKGESRALNLSKISDRIHESEEYIQMLKISKSAPDGQMLTATIESIEAEFKRYHQLATGNLRMTTGDRTDDMKEIFTPIFQALSEIDENDKDASLDRVKKAIQALGSYYYSDAETLFEEILYNAKDLAQRLGKESPSFKISAKGFSFPPKTKRVMEQVFMHLVRNSMDHGIEARDERIKKGKLEPYVPAKFETVIADNLVK